MSIDNLILKELKKLSQRLDDLEATVYKTGKTTRQERLQLKQHLQDLSQPKKKKEKDNTLQVGQFVETLSGLRRKGVIRCIACKDALPSHRTCDRNKCQHKFKHFAWVEWEDKRIIAYHFKQLILMSEDDLKPRIGRELSGRIGHWTFDAKTKLWKKDGSEKTFTEAEFDSELWFEGHPDDKEAADKFLTDIKKQLKKGAKI